MVEWRRIPGFPEHEVSEHGDVRRLVASGRYPAGHVLAKKKHGRGYIIYSLNNKDVLAHRLVAFAFLGPAPSPKHEVAHEDGTRTNNDYRNLRWKLPVDNQADRKRHGTYMAGEQCHWTVRLSDADVAEIRGAYAAGGQRFKGGRVTMQGLADKYGVSISQISRVVNGKQRASAA
jgi:hypothetical protein